MSSKEQIRSRFALDQLERFTAGGQRVSEELANFVVGTPTMILQNGFGQTMAYLLSTCKGNYDPNEKHYFTFRAIARWSERQNANISSNECTFFGSVAGLSQQEYLTLQEEALKMLQWLKRYARAFQEV
jgi:CRISPR-associated protein Cmr5